MDKKPSQISDVATIFYANPEIRGQYICDMIEGGKWELIFRLDILDESWKTVCQMYNNGTLYGISHLVCTTGKRRNPEKPNDSGTIRLYCGRASDQEKMLDIARNILHNVPYNIHKAIYYRSDKEPARQYYYMIPLPRDIRKPSEIHDMKVIFHANPAIRCRSIRHMTEGGKFEMFFNSDILDEKWETVTNLYDCGLLYGVSHLVCTTAKRRNPDKPNELGCITLYCGNASEKKKVLDIGRNILTYLSYEVYKVLSFRTEEDAVRNYFYVIRIPD